MKAKLNEIFSSIQGEGLYVGEEQLFVRFQGCNLSCSFCDENKKKEFCEYNCDEFIDRVISEKKKTVSLTGGEPLLHSHFLKEVLPILKKKKLQIYLETNGILKDALLEVLGLVDIISMDIKLPSSTGLRPYWDEHYAFLKEAVRKKVFVKVVVTPKTIRQDIEKAISIVRLVHKNIPFIIQPVSYNNKIAKIDSSDFLRVVKMSLNNVRIIPQVHKILGVR